MIVVDAAALVCVKSMMLLLVIVVDTAAVVCVKSMMLLLLLLLFVGDNVDVVIPVVC